MASEKVSVNPKQGVAKEMAELKAELMITNRFINQLLEYKESQLEQDTMWRNRWLHAKKIGARWTLATVFLAIAGVSVAGASFVLDLRSDGVVVEDKVKAYLHSEWDLIL